MALIRLAFAPMFLMAASAFASNLVFNPGFDTGDFSGWEHASWVTTTSEPGTIESPQSAPYFAESGCSGDPCIYGIPSQQAYLYQDLTTSAETYVLSFYYDLGTCGSCGAGQAEELQVLWNGIQVFDISTTSFALTDPGWQFVEMVVTGNSGTTRLEFLGRQDPGDIGLDTVSVSPTPEPSALWLAGAPAMLAVLRKRRQVQRFRSRGWDRLGLR
jgi:hypothetical protein